MIAPSHTAGRLDIDHAITKAVAPDHLPHHLAQGRAPHRLIDPKLSKRSIEPVKMRFLVNQTSVMHQHHLIDAVGKLVAAVLDMHHGVAMRYVTPVYIGDSGHARGPCSRGN